MPDFAEVHTDRLELRAVTAADLEALYPITSDARTWTHEPEGRHTEPEATRDWIERAAMRWERDGLSYWMLRRRPAGNEGAREVVGVGGVQRRSDRTWNLFYRLAPDAWGRGYATEMSRAAIDAAHACDEGVAVVAWILDRNHASRRVALRLGLIDQGLHPDPNDGVVRRTYADRLLDLEAPPGGAT